MSTRVDCPECGKHLTLVASSTKALDVHMRDHHPNWVRVGFMHYIHKDKLEEQNG